MGKYVLNATKTGYTFHLKAGNGETILTSEVYSTKDACENGIESMRKNAPAANIEDQTIAGYEEQKHPKFEIYEDKGGKTRFRLVARNGQNIGASEAYNSKQSCKNGIDSVVRNADSPVVEQEA